MMYQTFSVLEFLVGRINPNLSGMSVGNRMVETMFGVVDTAG